MIVRTLKKILLNAIIKFEQLGSAIPAVGRFNPIKGPFSALDYLKTGKLSGQVIHEGQGTGPIPEGSITALSKKDQHNHQPWEIFWTLSHTAQLTGPLRTWREPKNLACIEGSFNNLTRLKIKEENPFSKLFWEQPKRLKGAWTSIVSNWGRGDNYYHWIMDTLSRLYILDYLPETPSIIIPNSKLPFVKECLDLLGYENNSYCIREENIYPEKYYFCSPLSNSGCWNPIGLDWLRNKFSPYFKEESTYDKIFLTRRARLRTPENILEIESIFKNNNFEIIDCGDLSVRQQIEIMSGAKIIAGIHGAAMTNILWARPETIVLEIFQSHYLNACYEQIAFQGKLVYNHYIISESNDLTEISEWCKSN